MKIGMIDVGGGMRGAFGCGVMDRCLDDQIMVDYGIGVSAGSANLVTYFARQKGRCRQFYTDFAFRKQYMSFSNIMHGRTYLDLDYIYGTLSNSDGEYPLDYATAKASGKEFYIVACNALTGEPKYFTLDNGMAQDRYDALKASSCVPIAAVPYVIDGVPYVDGSLADPIPLEKAFNDGCDRVILILTKPKEHITQSVAYKMSEKWLRHKGYPNAADGMHEKSERYNAALDQAMQLEKEGKVLIVAPSSIEGMQTLKKDHKAIDDLYQKGYEEGGKVKAFLAGKQ
ncbi:patatin family protein [Galactobacillus timonensis]|uniref:patatin-like phospholipase family protein n=1 Tax=Galactobacillus timonensis TaxID=2041840 RepID=UPI00240A62CA|nr:patatin family protein [Galactobacillus timonensis]MDD6680029.1 patatin family protein [Galactobacillus timonensis]